ncbi:TRAP transporter small permease [Oceanospirillum sanctuarii]|uniref:TRAP transporter small permease n=1 Tax=Oceanospirillum sanctuarii TaxID=1434821 RepID=UPI000A36734A|nr:TRAP transporter small permease [Oceanospirillum sanctuarii]
MSFSRSVAAHYDEKGPIVWLAFFLESVAALTLFGLMLVTCFDVGGRYFLGNALDGATELTEIGLAILVFAEMPVITWRSGHVIVDILDRMLSSVAIRILGLLSALIISGSFSVLGIQIYKLAERSLRRDEITELLQLPTGYIITFIAIMSWLTAATMISYGVYQQLSNSRRA